MLKYFCRWYMVIERVGGVVLAFHRLLFGYRWDLLEVVWDLFISFSFASLLDRLPNMRLTKVVED